MEPSTCFKRTHARHQALEIIVGAKTDRPWAKYSHANTFKILSNQDHFEIYADQIGSEKGMRIKRL